MSTSAVTCSSRVDEAGRTVIKIAGRLDVTSTGRIWDPAVRALPAKADAVLDASDLEYCDGSGISLMHELASRQRRRGSSLHIVGLHEEIQSFLDLTRIDDELTEAPCPSRKPFPELVGAATTSLCADAAGLVASIGEVSLGLLRALLAPHRVRWGSVLESCTTAGAYALLVVALIGFLLGWVMAFSAAFIMHDYGADTLLAALIGPAMVRELGPLMTCVVIAGRSGSAFAAEIGTMKINEEIDALDTMGIDPVRFLVTPKVLAAMVMTPLLTMFANVAGVVGGGLVSRYILGQPTVIYTNLLQEVVQIGDVVLGLIKAVIFGVIVAAIGCIRGLQTERTPTAVGESTTSAVVTSIVFLAIADAILAVIIKVLEV